MNNLDWVLVATFFAILTVILVVWSAFVDGREDDRAHGRLEEQQVASGPPTGGRDAKGAEGPTMIIHCEGNGRVAHCGADYHAGHNEFVTPYYGFYHPILERVLTPADYGINCPQCIALLEPETAPA